MICPSHMDVALEHRKTAGPYCAGTIAWAGTLPRFDLYWPRAAERSPKLSSLGEKLWKWENKSHYFPKHLKLLVHLHCIFCSLCICRRCSWVGWCGGQWTCSAMCVTGLLSPVLSFPSFTLMKKMVTIIFVPFCVHFHGINWTQGNNC